MGALLTVSPTAFGRAECTERQLNISETNCSDRGMIHYDCYQNADGGFSSVCCEVGAPCDTGGGIVFHFESDGELPEDDDRGEPVDPPPSPHDEDELVDEEPGFSDDDGDITGADDGDTGDDGFDTGDADDTSADDDHTQADGDLDTEPEVSDTSAGCSTVGQAGGGLMALILGALLGLTRRQVRLS